VAIGLSYSIRRAAIVVAAESATLRAKCSAFFPTQRRLGLTVLKCRSQVSKHGCPAALVQMLVPRTDFLLNASVCKGVDAFPRSY